MPEISQTELRDCLREYFGATADVAGVQVAVLFGSAARQTWSPGSDVDLAILLAGSGNRESRLRAIDMELGRLIRRAIDVIDLDRAPPLLRFEVVRHGVVLYERDRHSWTVFSARAMRDWWDWAPTARRMAEVAFSSLERELAHGSG